MKKILIVDDHAPVLRVLKLGIEEAGYEVDTASNGSECLVKLCSGKPDFLVKDIDMPRMNGRELCMEIMRTMPERLFPIFVLTARAEDEHRVWSAQLDNLDFMEKPVSIRRMLAMLDNYFAGSQAAGERACQ